MNKDIKKDYNKIKLWEKAKFETTVDKLKEYYSREIDKILEKYDIDPGFYFFFGGVINDGLLKDMEVSVRERNRRKNINFRRH